MMSQGGGPPEQEAGRPADLFSQGIFSSQKRAWMAVALYTFILYTTLTLTYDFYIWVFNQIGENRVKMLFNFTYAVLGLALLGFFLFRLRWRTGALAALLIICAITAYVLSLEKIPANRIHFLQYGPLTFLVTDALRFRCRDRYIYVWTFLIVSLIGVGDELLQGVAPDRRFDFHDVVLNALAAALTLALIGWVIRGESKS